MLYHLYSKEIHYLLSKTIAIEWSNTRNRAVRSA